MNLQEAVKAVSAKIQSMQFDGEDPTKIIMDDGREIEVPRKVKKLTKDADGMLTGMLESAAVVDRVCAATDWDPAVARPILEAYRLTALRETVARLTRELAELRAAFAEAVDVARTAGKGWDEALEREDELERVIGLDA